MVHTDTPHTPCIIHTHTTHTIPTHIAQTCVWCVRCVFPRLNEAPVTGYGRDVGTKTTLRITYPEGAIQRAERYESSSLFVFSAFKPLDFKWLRQMVFKEKLVRDPHNWLGLGVGVCGGGVCRSL